MEKIIIVLGACLCLSLCSFAQSGGQNTKASNDQESDKKVIQNREDVLQGTSDTTMIDPTRSAGKDSVNAAGPPLTSPATSNPASRKNRNIDKAIERKRKTASDTLMNKE